MESEKIMDLKQTQNWQLLDGVYLSNLTKKIHLKSPYQVLSFVFPQLRF